MSSGYAVFRKFYLKLIDVLPMDDIIFIAELFASGLLHGDLKDEISALKTKRRKTAYFLDKAIEPSIRSQVGTEFDVLLTVMESCEFENVKKLAKEIKREHTTCKCKSVKHKL